MPKFAWAINLRCWCDCGVQHVDEFIPTNITSNDLVVSLKRLQNFKNLL
ncbi:hypothetical protein OSU_2850 [Vibrio cholerae PS15]|nr:hypothetical protein OSU_2850 [Vibrio cholerae PS15]